MTGFLGFCFVFGLLFSLTVQIVLEIFSTVHTATTRFFTVL